MAVHKTLLMEAIEIEMKGRGRYTSISAYLRSKMKAGWKLWEIQADISHHTGIHVSLASLSLWTRVLGYSKAQAARAAWEEDMILETPMADVRQRHRRIRRVV